MNETCVLKKVWQQKQQEMFEDIRSNNVPLKLGGDARCCSPGHTAKFGSYSLMDLDTSKVVEIQLVQVNIIIKASKTLVSDWLRLRAMLSYKIFCKLKIVLRGE